MMRCYVNMENTQGRKRKINDAFCLIFRKKMSLHVLANILWRFVASSRHDNIKGKSTVILDFESEVENMCCANCFL